jgi:hypothetical protein
MDSMRRGGWSSRQALTPDGVADVLERLWAAGGAVADELDRIGASRALVSAATVAGLEAALASLRPAVGMRALLAHLEPGLLRAGTAVWARREGAAARWADTPAAARSTVGGQR